MGEKGNKFFVNGYAYFTKQCTNKRRYMRCAKAKQLGCRSKAILHMSKPMKVVITEPHNHPKDGKIEKQVEEFFEQLKLACMSGINLPVKVIYDDIAKVYPEVANFKPFSSIRSSMCRWKLLGK